MNAHSKAEKELLEELSGLPVIDTHEHLPPESQLAQASPDVFDLLVPYVCDLLISAGMPRRDWDIVMDKAISFKRRWELLEPWLPPVRHTAYFEAVEKSIVFACGENTLTGETAARISSILAERAEPELYRKIFSRLHIESALTFVHYDEMSGYAGSILRTVPTVSHITPANRSEIMKIETESGCRVSTLQKLEGAIEKLFEGYAASGVRAVKFGNAYQRTLDFGIRDRAAAERVFEKAASTVTHGNTDMLGRPEPALRQEELIPLDNYLTHFMVDAAAAAGLPVIFHTGFHAWTRNRPDRCRPENLTGLIESHPETVFVLLHSGIPFVKEAVLLAAYYPNVHINMTWMHIIDRLQAVDAVGTYLQMLPLNKISAFGGDYLYVENIAGHLQICLENLAQAFSREMGSGRIEKQDCIEICRLWLYDNPKQLFRLP